MRTLLAIARKDATVVTRDKAAVLVLIAMPLALIFILGSALGNMGSGDFTIKVGLVNLDSGDVGAKFVEGLTGTREITNIFDITQSDDAAAIRHGVEQGDLAAALIIPEGTSDRIAAREAVTLELLQDPGSKTSAGIWAGVVRAAVSYASANLVIGRVVEDEFAKPAGVLHGTGGASAPAAAAPGAIGAPPVTGDVAAPQLTAVTAREVKAKTDKRVPMMSYYAAGMTAMFLLFGSMFGAFALVTERRQQTLARMLVAPASKVQIVAGKGLGIAIVGIGQLVVLLVGTKLLFGVDWGVHIEAIVLLGVAEVFAATGMAMTLAALGKTERAIGGIGPAAIMLFAATGGSMFPVDAMPSWLKPLQVIAPTYWTLGGFLDVIRGATVADVAWRAGIVMVIAVVLYAFGIWRLRYE